MSGFKRMQSKVFWGQMAAIDFENIPLICRNVENTNNTNLVDNSYCNFGRESDTDTDKNSDIDEVHDNHIVTVINLQMSVKKTIDNKSMENIVDKTPKSSKNVLEIEHNNNNDENYIQPFSGDTEILENDIKMDNNDNKIVEKSPDSLKDKKKYCNNLNNNSTFFSTDREHRSLDSGFSDSETSKDNKDSENDAKTRRKRRKKLRDYERRSGRLHCQWKSHDFLANPVHSSTPKSTMSGQALKPRLKLMRERDISDVIGHEDKNLIINRIDNKVPSPKMCVNQYQYPSQGEEEEEEHLGDFLYTTEPPDDETTSASNSTASAHSIVGYWYTKISSESSAGSRLKDFEKNKSHSAVFKESSQGSVKAWLNDLVNDVDYECLVTLQSKALPRKNRLIEHSEEAQNRDLRMLTVSATAAATQIIIRAEEFCRHIQEVIKEISSMENSRSQRKLLHNIEDEAFSILSELGAPPPRRIHDGSLKSILSQLKSLKEAVNSVLDTRLDFYIERVVRGLEDAPRETGSAARGALAALTALGLAGKRAGNSIARCSGIRALLTSVISSSRSSSELRASSLRALSSVCCCPLAIEHFVKEGGPEIIVDLLSYPTTPELEKVEATALIVQITAPWTEALGLKYFEPFANLLVNTLTNLSESTTCNQTLLLAAAALNNLANSIKCIQAIVRVDVVKKLLRCIKKTSGRNIWLMEQVAALIGKLAKHPEVRGYLAQAKASVALVYFLRMAPPGLEDAYKRLTTTAAMALTRLCVDPEIARQVVAVGGADCLPTCDEKNVNVQDNSDNRFGNFQYTKSLRVAHKVAKKQIHQAKAYEYSI